MFTARNIVSEPLYLGQRLILEMWLGRGLGQAWRLSAAKGIAVALRRARQKYKRTAVRRIEVAKGKYALTRVCLTMKTMDIKHFMLRFI